LGVCRFPSEQPLQRHRGDLLWAGFKLIEDILECDPVFPKEATAIIANNADEDLVLMIAPCLITESAFA